MSALQQQFVEDVSKLIQFAVSQPGIKVRAGEMWRTPEQAQWNADHGTGIACSLHLQRLAVDLLVDLNGIWQQDDSAGCYAKLGEFWKSLGADHYWGGDFTKKDYDHFSISPDGGHTR